MRGSPRLMPVSSQWLATWPHNKTPHALVLVWMEDYLRLWKERNLGWALWNFRGSFGVLDSGREDVEYEPFHGHQLDRKMLDLLLKF